MQTKTIVLVSALEPWSIASGAGAPSLFETIKGYSDNGFEITYITYEKKAAKTSLSHTKNIDLELPGLSIIRVRKKSAPHLFGSRVASKLGRLIYEPLTLLEALKNHLKERKSPPRILYAYEAQAIHAISKLNEELKKDSVVVNRFQGTILGRKYDNVLHCLRKYEMFRILRDKADRYVMTNDGTFGDHALRYWNKHVDDNNLLFVRNGFNFEKFVKSRERTEVLNSLGLDPSNFYAFTVSRLTLWKRVDRAIELINKFQKEYPKLHLIVVGDGEHRPNLEQMAKTLNISDRVHFLGGQARERVAEFMATLDVFLSLYDVSNLGNPLFEAMICGQCVVTLNNGTTNEVISHDENGIIVEPDDTEALYKEFQSVLEDDSRRIRLKHASKEWADKNLESWPDRMRKEIHWVLRK